MFYYCITLYILLIAKIKDVEDFTWLTLHAISSQNGPHIQDLVQTEHDEIECTVRASTMYEAIGQTDMGKILNQLPFVFEANLKGNVITAIRFVCNSVFLQSRPGGPKLFIV